MKLPFTKTRKPDVDLTDVARGTVLMYFQSWGQGIQGRVDALNEAVKAAGINAEFVQEEGRIGWLGTESEAERAEKFRNELDAYCWPKGVFEEEEAAVYSLLAQWRNKG